MKYLIAALFIFTIACNETTTTQVEERDTMPVITPEISDTSRVITPPPTGDSNVVHPDTTIKSK